MKLTKKLLSVLLAAVMLACAAAPAASAYETAQTKRYPSIVIPGVFQSEVKYLDADGNEMMNADGQPYSAPFFMEDTTDIVKNALTKAVLPLASLLITQRDKDARCAKAVADVLGEALASNIKCDSEGRFEKNIQATRYTTSMANLSEYDRNYCLRHIPLYDYADIAGYENLYFFSYASLGNIYEIAQELFDLIQIAKSETGAEKVNIAPISQGGSIFNALMQLYRDKGVPLSRDIHRVCYMVPAADGTVILGDIYRYGLLDDDNALYGYMFPSLLKEQQQWLAYLINLILRVMPNADVNHIIDTAVHTLVEEYLEYSTCLWALTPSKDYAALREMYLMDADNDVIRAQTDWYHNAQVNAKSYILEAKADGVEFFDVVDYNYSLYRICDSWDRVNADGIINTDSESFGATSRGVDAPLGAQYVQQNTYCTDPTHNHIDAAGVLDASTGLLCETTFYFFGQNHERTSDNDVIIRLATRILADDSFTGIDSDPAFPQFNYARNSKRLRNLYNAWAHYDASALPEAQSVALTAALRDAETALASTVMKTADYNAAYDRLNAVTDEIVNGENAGGDSVNGFLRFLTNLFRILSDLLNRFFGGKGFSEMIAGK